MPVKSIVILANSFKHRRRCIAGKEVHQSANNRWRLTQDWYRPVTIDTATHGAVDLATCTDRASGREFRLMDIVEIEFDAPAPEQGQPENWTFNADSPWTKVGRFQAAVALNLLDRPSDVWNDPFSANISLVSEAYTVAGQVEQSLALIQPEEFRLNLSNDHNPWDCGYKRKLRAAFVYNGVEYSGIGVTDPNVWRYCEDRFPGPGHPSEEITLPGGDRYSLCLSLAPPFPDNNNTQSKLVAGVIKQR